MGGFKMVSDVQFVGVGYTAIAKDGVKTSDSINLESLNAEGFFGLDLTITSAGAATAKVEILACATKTGTYKVPVIAADGSAIDDIVTAAPVGSNYYAFPPFPVTPFIKIRITENDFAAITKATLRIVIQ